ncbi:hypothetical protein DICVIV_11715 [Dictyocaulus viviparus]|uniref:Uncharacterized protein n=1 Tax=Dictyocaulus viviparus TaxID=29172 RepID=A0A0D8XIZ7_DICVI|nr:hypothetical protein DICVIV_11715 [Dictyocaulus viviparus]
MKNRTVRQNDSIFPTLLTANIKNITRKSEGSEGIANFLCIIVFMSAVSKEVGNKIHPASEMDDPLFHFEYGFSFILLKCTFLLNELAALFSIVVFMAKRDERTFNRYKIRSLLKSCSLLMSDERTESELIQERSNHPQTRFVRGRYAGISLFLIVSIRRNVTSSKHGFILFLDLSLCD